MLQRHFVLGYKGWPELGQLLQVRIQLGQGSGYDVEKNMLRDEGFGALYIC